MNTIAEIKKDNYYLLYSILPIYKSHILIGFYKSLKDYYRLLDELETIGIDLQEYKNEDWFKCYGWQISINAESKKHLVLFNISDKTYLDNLTDTISHETYHLVQSIAVHHGLTMSRHTPNEHIAYLIGYLNNYITRIVNDKSNI